MSLVFTVDPEGVLTVRSSADESIAITVDAGNVKINGQDPSLLAPTPALDITAILVQGGLEDNTIDLSGVGRAEFPNLADGSVTVRGGAGDDSIIGSQLADVLNGNFGDDTVVGGDGHDQLTGGPGADSLDGAGGQDTLLETLTVPVVTLTGTSYIDTETDVLASIEQATIKGTDADERVDATEFGGKLRIEGGGGRDTLLGGTGSDTLSGGRGSDLLVGGEGDDVLLGFTGRNTLEGGDGLDFVDLSDVPGREPASGSRVRLRADGSGFARGPLARTRFIDIEGVVGSVFNDRIVSERTEGATIFGGRGNDKITVRSGTNFVDGGDGHDRIRGGTGNDTLLGNAGNDRLRDDLGDGLLDGGDDRDVLRKRHGSATLIGGEGKDTILAGDGFDCIEGGAGNDFIRSGPGDDLFVDGGPDRDTVDGAVG